MTNSEIIEYIRNIMAKELPEYKFNSTNVYKFLNNYTEHVETYIDRYSRRWWDEFDTVCKLDDMYIRHNDAKANRDMSVIELGWEFDMKSIVEVEPYTETIVVTKWREKQC